LQNGIDAQKLFNIIYFKHIKLYILLLFILQNILYHIDKVFLYEDKKEIRGQSETVN